jgi:hypothetical protein
LNPAEVEVADDAGALVAPPAPAAAPLPVRTAPEPADPAEPPSACVGELHGTEVVVVVDEAAADLDLAVVVVGADVEVVVHGTVVALPAAWAIPASVPPPDAPRYGETRAPHDVAMRPTAARTPRSPADLFVTSAPRAQAYLGNTVVAAALRGSRREDSGLFSR